MLHKIKLKEQFCDAVLNGVKKFEIRFNDRGYQPGDYIQFLPISSDRGEFVERIEHPVQEKTYRITYILSGNGLKENFIVFGIEEVV